MHSIASHRVKNLIFCIRLNWLAGVLNMQIIINIYGWDGKKESHASAFYGGNKRKGMKTLLIPQIKYCLIYRQRALFAVGNRFFPYSTFILQRKSSQTHELRCKEWEDNSKNFELFSSFMVVVRVFLCAFPCENKYAYHTWNSMRRILFTLIISSQLQATFMWQETNVLKWQKIIQNLLDIQKHFPVLLFARNMLFAPESFLDHRLK